MADRERALSEDEILFAGLAWKGYPAIKKAMDDRTEKIRGDLDSAERAKTESETVLADYQRQLTDARDFPALHVAIGSGALDDDDDLDREFDFGLACILDGVQALIGRG